jgi:hypothetical protein
MEQFLMGNSSLSEFINASAKLMLADRPHLWTDLDDAISDVTEAFSEVSSIDPDDWDEYSVHLSGFIMTRTVLDEGVFEYTLAKKLVSLGIYTGDEESGVHDWTKGSELVKDLQLNLTEVDQDLDIEPDINDDIYYEDPEEQ